MLYLNLIYRRGIEDMLYWQDFTGKVVNMYIVSRNINIYVDISKKNYYKRGHLLSSADLYIYGLTWKWY